MSHQLSEHHHHNDINEFNKKFKIGIILNITFVVVEVIFGLFYNSLALVADAGHNFSDVISLVLAWSANYLITKESTANFTYGFKKTSIIWYQGESNADRPFEYNDLFTTMINDWRSKWNEGNFPFLFVQLPNFMEAKSEPSESNWALLREAQLETLSVPSTGMAVTIDIGEWNDIHPLDKRDVGKRLFLAAEKVAYGNNTVEYSGPIYKSMKIEGNKIILSFDHVAEGLKTKNNKELKGFAIAGPDKHFVWAKAKIENNKVIVWNNDVEKPIAVRYAWADNPDNANLYNSAGLPASPFRTDNF